MSVKENFTNNLFIISIMSGVSPDNEFFLLVFSSSTTNTNSTDYTINYAIYIYWFLKLFTIIIALLLFYICNRKTYSLSVLIYNMFLITIFSEFYLIYYFLNTIIFGQQC